MDLRSDYNFVKSYVNRKFNFVTYGKTSEDASHHVLIKIKTGLLAGEQRQIDKSTIVVGSGNFSDILLIDDGIEDQHLEITFARDLFGLKSTVKALAPGVKIPVYGTLMPGEIRTIRGSSNLSIANIIMIIDSIRHHDQSTKEVVTTKALHDLDIQKQELESSKKVSSKANKKKAIIFSSLAVVLSIVGLFITARTGLKTHVMPNNHNAVITTQKIAPTQFVSLLQAQIRDTGLDKRLSVLLNNDGTVEVSGSIPENLMPKWRQILKWYDQQLGIPTLLSLVQPVSNEADLPKVRYVWFGKKDPHIILSNGQRADIGETIGKGWTVNKIESDGLVISLSGRNVKLSFK